MDQIHFSYLCWSPYDHFCQIILNFDQSYYRYITFVLALSTSPKPLAHWDLALMLRVITETSCDNLLLSQRLVYLFVCFVALRPKSTGMVMAGRSVHLTTLFPGQA